MRLFYTRIFTLGLLVMGLLLSSCSSVDDEDASLLPSPLPDFETTLKIKPLWSVGTSASIKGAFSRIQPAIAYDKVYVVGSSGIVEARAIETGKKIWSTETGAFIESGVAAASNIVVVGSEEGEVIALDAKTGKELWRNLVSSEILSPAAIGEGFVVVRTVDGKLFGLDAKLGERKWFFDRNVPILTLRGTSSPIISRGAVVAGFDNGKVALFLLENGKPIWEKRIAQSAGRSELERIVDMDAKPLLVGDSLYAVTYNGNIASINVRTGQVNWQREMSSFQNISTDGLRLYITTADDEVKALSINGGATFWTQKSLLNRKLSAPVVAGDYVVVTDFEGYIHWMSVKDGHFVKRQHLTSSGISGNPVVKGRYLAIQGRDGDLMMVKIPETTYQ